MSQQFINAKLLMVRPMSNGSVKITIEVSRQEWSSYVRGFISTDGRHVGVCLGFEDSSFAEVPPSGPKIAVEMTPLEKAIDEKRVVTQPPAKIVIPTTQAAMKPTVDDMPDFPPELDRRPKSGSPFARLGEP